MSMFHIYSQKSCQFECRLRYARDRVGCVPWDYPVPTDVEGGVPVCIKNLDNNMVKEFSAAMDEADIEACDCLPDCEAVHYEVQVDKIPLPSPELLCPRKV